MKKLLILFILLGLMTIGGYVWWNNGLRPVDPKNTTSKFFVIPPGQGVREIANNLKKQGLIKDPVVFFLYVKQQGIDAKIQAGDFKLSPSMSAQEIADNLTHGSLDVWVTIPEGKRADEIADILQEKIPSYEETWRTTLKTEEGYLFPDTYLIPKDANILTIVNIMNNNFYTKINSIGLSKENPQLKKIVIIASLIEREAITDGEKPIISGIIQNRLGEDMALQIDATIQYAKGKQGNTWWAPVSLTEYKSVKSSYNTYLFPGLPPGPIANPGIESLKAALNPTDTPYFYYLHDKNGIIRYAKTNEEHNTNIQKYGL